MGIPKYELNRQPLNVAADQEFDPNSTNAVSGQALNQELSAVIALEYSATSIYNVGDLVLHDGKLYSCIVRITKAEAWTEAHWEQVRLNAFIQKKYPNLITSISYDLLLSERNNGLLIPGMLYRITDFRTTSSDQDTYCAGHLFDIIVLATDASHLDENAFATHHAGDTYFQNCDLEAWQLKYCIDNDTDRFSWAQNDANGRGVIYWMRDEWGNECSYDFKNIMFRRYKITACAQSPDLVELYSVSGISGMTVDTENPVWAYTFCMIDTDNDEAHDVSVEQELYPNDEGYYNHIHDNVFKTYYNTVEDGNDGVIEVMVLPNNVFVTDTDISGGEFYGFYNNTFGNGCSSNTFGNDFNYNTFWNDCSSNTFGNGCISNTFGNGFYSNTFGNNCSYNTFGNGCYSNTFGNYCSSNTFGNYCNYNTFGNYCSSNTFGNNCQNNTFGNGCNYNTFGNNCSYNTFGNYCCHITVFDGVQYCSVTGGSSNSYVQNAQILNGTAGENGDLLTIAFDPGESYTQVACFNSSGSLTVFCPADSHPT